MPKKILLADDSVTIQKVVELTFAEGDYAVECVSNGKAAVQKIQDDRPDILLCDVIMPEMNGYDVASFVKKNPAYSGIPVILLTGTFEPFDEEKARLSGADTYVTKPFDSKLLVDKVEELLSHRLVLDSSAPMEPAQVFQAREEFLLVHEPRVEREGAAAAPAKPAEPFEQVFEQEAPPEKAAVETVQVLSAPPPAAVEPSAVHEEPEVHPASEAAWPTEWESEPLPVEPKPEQAAALPVTEAIQPEEPFESIDLGPLPPEEATEQSFEEIVAPPHGTKDEVVIGVAGPEDAGEPDVLEADLSAGSAPPFEAAPVSVMGAEDWGEGRRPAAPGVIEPEARPAEASSQDAELLPVEEAMDESLIVHDMTEQQDMISQAQAKADAPVSAFAGAPEEIVEAPSVELPKIEGDLVPAYEEVFPSSADTAEQVQPEEPRLEEGPFLQEGEVLSGLPEVPAEQMSEAVRAPLAPGEHTEELPAGMEEVSPFEEPAPGTQPEEPTVAAPVPAGPLPAEPEPAASAAQVAVPPGISREELEQSVRKAVAEVHPGVAREAAQAMAPAVIAETVREMAPDHIRAIVSDMAGAHIREIAREIAPDHAATVARETVPGAVQQAVAQQAPDLVRRAVAESAPAAVREAVREHAEQMAPEAVQAAVRDAVLQVLRETAPEIIRQVAWEVIPEMAETLIRRRIQELETEAG
ncbi:MAG: response regulator [Acidobacteriota bacterium]